MRTHKISVLHLVVLIQIDRYHHFSWATPWGGRGNARIGHKPYGPRYAEGEWAPERLNGPRHSATLTYPGVLRSEAHPQDTAVQNKLTVIFNASYFSNKQLGLHLGIYLPEAPCCHIAEEDNKR